jgi:hypothetical protein
MKRLLLVSAGTAAMLLAGCSNGDATDSGNQYEAQSWSTWHDEKQQVDRTVLKAINEPDGGDYATAADAIRHSNRPPAVKQFQLGQLIVGGFMAKSKRRPPESLEQGMRMMEDSAFVPGQKPLSLAQQMHFLFGPAEGAEEENFLVDPQIAACWREIDEDRANDPARCIALRRQRMPNLDQRPEARR